MLRDLLIKKKIEQIKNHYVHPPLHLERELLEEIKRGNKIGAKRIMQAIDEYTPAKLSDDRIRSIRNSYIALTALVTRVAIDVEVSFETAFSLSDYYINQFEKLDKPNELDELKYKMIDDFIILINDVQPLTYTLHVIRSIKYINLNITEKLSLQNIADELNLSKEYLSGIFKKEVGISITDYIHREKIKEAKNMLKFSDLHLTDIAILFNYSDVSHFGKMFKKYTGLTPKQYKIFKSGARH